MINRHVTVPGADLHYEIRGDGPLLLVIGSPMAAAEFAPLADALASDHTVVTYDPRGHGSSAISGPDDDATPDQRADDIAAILDDLGAADADVFGSSGGAVTGLALVSRHAARVRTLVAHEPPLLELLPDAEDQRRAGRAARHQAGGLPGRPRRIPRCAGRVRGPAAGGFVVALWHTRTHVRYSDCPA
jgi:pimeloyl-ACP methyl ester carboxylesterase